MPNSAQSYSFNSPAHLCIFAQDIHTLCVQKFSLTSQIQQSTWAYISLNTCFDPPLLRKGQADMEGLRVSKTPPALTFPSLTSGDCWIVHPNEDVRRELAKSFQNCKINKRIQRFFSLVCCLCIPMSLCELCWRAAAVHLPVRQQELTSAAAHLQAILCCESWSGTATPQILGRIWASAPRASLDPSLLNFTVQVNSWYVFGEVQSVQ